MPLKTIVGAASPDEPRRMSAAEAVVLLDDVAIERVVNEWRAQERYGAEFPDRYVPELPTLTFDEFVEALRRWDEVRQRRTRGYRFVCSRAAAARRAAASGEVER